MIEPLFHGSTWNGPYVKDTVFISQHLLQPSIIKSSLQLIRENLKGMFIWGKPLQLSESVTNKSLDIFLKKSKNGFHENAIADFVTYMYRKQDLSE